MGDVDVERLAALAGRLRAAHDMDRPLLLPNAWDAASARAVVGAGFPVVATTSGGVAAALGYPDGERIPADEMFAAVARIAAAVDAPVTADIESGYGLPAGELVARLLDAGAVGCNLEDTDHRQRASLIPLEEQAERLAAVKHAARQAGVDIVLNARIDVFVQQVGDHGERVSLALQRASRYAEAGADCVYPILADAQQLAEFEAGHSGPVNGMVLPAGPQLAELLRIGIARISFGSGLHRIANQDLQRRLGAIADGDDGWATPVPNPQEGRPKTPCGTRENVTPGRPSDHPPLASQRAVESQSISVQNRLQPWAPPAIRLRNVDLMELLRRASEEFVRRVALVTPEDLDRPTPCPDWNVAMLVRHVIGGDYAYAALLHGATADEFRAALETTTVAQDLRVQARSSADAVIDAFAEQGALERMVNHPMGQIPGRRLLGMRACEWAIHGWDLAQAVHADDGIDLTVATALYDELFSRADTLSATGYFQPPAGTPADAPVQVRLLDILGRRAENSA